MTEGGPGSGEPAFGRTAVTGSGEPAFGRIAVTGSGEPAFGRIAVTGSSEPAFGRIAVTGSSEPAFGRIAVTGSGEPAFGRIAVTGSGEPAFGRIAGGAAPLGVFDSGLGGLTVVRALRAALPGESLVYLGDTARVPYGTRSAETVVRYARGCARLLTERGVKGLVVACNTVSAVAVEVLRAELDLPVLGVIEPGALAATQAIATLPPSTPPPRIGVLGTAGTIASGAYPRAVAQLSTRWEVVGQAAPLLVPLVEEGWLEGAVPELAARRYLAPLIDAGARVVVLGCTHYPLLQGVIERVASELCGEPVPVVNGAEATAAAVAAWLAEGRLVPAPGGGRGSLELLVTDRPGSFGAVAERFLGEPLPDVVQVDLVP